MPLSSKELGKLRIWFLSKGFPLETELLRRIEIYHDLINTWSKRINLVSKRDLDMIIGNHFLDSLAALEAVRPDDRVLDIGSGAGFPGIPLAMVSPSLQVTLLESVHKRALFLKEAKSILSLENVQIMEGRFEYLDFRDDYDAVTIRALPKWQIYLDRIREILKADGKVIYFSRRGTIEIFGTSRV